MRQGATPGPPGVGIVLPFFKPRFVVAQQVNDQNDQPDNQQ
jgi:hypothetical protein